MVGDAADRRWLDAVRDEVDRVAPDLVVLDHLRTGAALELVRHQAPIWYQAQNHETRWKREVLDATGWRSPRKMALAWDLWRLARLERAVIDAAALVTTITDQDHESHRAMYPWAAGRITTLPPVYRGPRVAHRTIDETVPRRVVIVTSLDWGVKRENAAAFLDAAARPFQAAGVQLAVVCRGRPPADWVERYPNVTFEDHIDDLDAYLARARLAMIHEPGGGGFKMKILEFVFNRVPIVALDESMAGSGLEARTGFVPVESAVDGVGACLELIDDFDRLNRLHAAAVAQAGPRFDAAFAGTQLAARLRSIITDDCRPEGP
jgi:hypothetical protein